MSLATAATANARSPAPVSHTYHPLGHVRSPAGAVVASGSGGAFAVRAPGARIEDVLRTTVDPTDVRTQVDAVRFLIEADTGVRLPDLRPAHTREAHSAFHVLPPEPGSESAAEPAPPETDPEPAGTLSFPSPAGDLSGDGLADVLSLDITLPEETVELRALRGTDGAQLWSRTLDETADAAAWPTGDLTGDGIEDLLLMGLEVHSETETEDCPEDSFDHCRFDYAAEYTWLSGVLSGADGSLLWSDTRPGSLSYHFSFESQDDDLVTDGYRVEESLKSVNLGVFPYGSGDHDGDGLDDLVIESIDLDFDISYESRRTVVVYEDTGAFSLESSTRASVVGGDDGRLLMSRASEPGPAIAELEPVGDLVGTSAPELLWKEAIFTNDTYSCVRVVVERCSDERDSTVVFAVEAIDGATLETTWRNTLEGVDISISYSLGADLSGDGVEDIAQFTITFSEEDEPVTRVLSGRDGALLWERRGPDDEFPMTVGEFGGVPGNDLLLASFVFSGDPDLLNDAEDYQIRLTRVDGPTGRTLLETTRTVATLRSDPDADGYGIYMYVGEMGDADGDGSKDVYAGGISYILDYDEASGWFVPTEAESTAFVESGRDGVQPLAKTSEDLMIFEGVTDLEGDSRADVFEWHDPLDPFAQDARFDLVVQRAAPDNVLWRRSFVGDEFWLGTLWPGGDHDGRPGEELVFGDNSEGPAGWRSSVGSLAGADGSIRWLVER